MFITTVFQIVNMLFLLMILIGVPYLLFHVLPKHKKHSAEQLDHIEQMLEKNINN